MSKEAVPQLGRLQGLMVDAARAGALSNPFTEIRRPRGLRTLHLEALWWLRSEGLLSVNQVTHRLGISVSKTTRLVDRLEELELVWRDRWEDDRRVVRVHLTEKGRGLAEQADQAIQQRVGSLLLPLNPAERDTFLALLERIVDAQRTRVARKPQ
ncbi:MAG: MarR family transcriptional regulator [Myxococcota bacterium]|nr:MarR family transcriptional regulator [Myxococcota bacterium]